MTIRNRRNNKGKQGQVMVFLVMALVILFFVVLWNFDLHKLIYVKSVSQNAGDSASLMGARWQGITLNLVGDLNIMQALALSTGDTNVIPAISNIQARLCFVGPMVGFFAAQQAAKNNGMLPNGPFSEYLIEHADEVLDDYTEIGDDGLPLFPPPYPEAWTNYAEMLLFIGQEGVVAGPDNMRLYSDPSGSHVLHQIDFYEAIAGRNWCWFLHNEPTLLEDYQNFFPCWWPPLPLPPVAYYGNSEIFGLGLRTAEMSLHSTSLTVPELNDIAAERELDGTVTSNAADQSATWFCYDPNVWTDWTIMYDNDDHRFPLVGELKDQYNYAGADSVVRVEATTGRLTPGAGGESISNTIVWTSAAKPFGYLENDRRPDTYGIVLPAFHDVRMIPIDSSSSPSGGSYNLGWREHIEAHLDEYMENGPLNNGCWFCARLRTWEGEAFRRGGVRWLELYSDDCFVPGNGPGSPGGGTRIGH